ADNFIQWKYEDETVWNNLISLTTLTGAKGDQGDPGIDGREVLFQVADNYIQWKYEDETVWNNLISLTTLTGAKGDQGDPGIDGREVLFQVADNFIQWKYEDETVWNNLIEISTLTGQTGIGISNTAINEYGELIITYTDNTIINIGQIVKVYLVSFTNIEGNIIKSQLILWGSDAVAPTLPTIEGHTFVQWDQAYTNVKANLVINPIYNTSTFTVTFDSNGGSSVSTIVNVLYDTTIVLSDSTKVGYDFLGWYTGNSIHDVLFNSSSTVKGNITLYAKWQLKYYQVQFFDGETLLSKQAVFYGFSAVPPVEPTKIGYEFMGWSTSYHNITSNVDLQSTYNANLYTITFEENGGSTVTDLTQGYESIVLQPTTPTKTGYSFIGWFSNQELTESYVFSTMPLNGITLYAKWSINQYTISFNANGGSETANITENYQTSLTAPTDPTKVGYTFGGWFTDSGFENEYVFTTMPAFDVELNAKWTINQYTIVFEENDGTVVSDITQNYGTTVTKPTDPTKTGYSFINWYVDSAFTEVYAFTTMPALNITLYAKWTINQYTIDFEENGGSSVTAIIQDYGTVVVEPANPTRVTYIFVGWFLDANLTESYTFTTMADENIVLYAKWTDEQYTISFEENGGSIVEDIVGSYQSSVTEPEAPTKEGNTFAGWFQDELLTEPYSFTTMPLGGITIYVKWNINSYTLTYQDYTDITNPDLYLGDSHVMLIASTKQIFAWGQNGYGQLGDGTTTSRLQPVDITQQFQFIDDEYITLLSLANHSAAITNKGRVFLWGYNSNGQIGNGTKTHQLIPVDITSYFGFGEGEVPIKITTGYSNTILLTSTGRIFSWGYNGFGQVGDGTTTERTTPVDITNKFTFNIGETVEYFVLGDAFAHMVTSENRIFGWGANFPYGNVGEGITEPNRTLPIEITNKFNLNVDETIVKLITSSTSAFSLALSSEGRLFAWGKNSNYSLGDGTTSIKTSPKEITHLFFDLEDDEVINNVFTSKDTGYAITSKNKIYSWGYNACGQIGNGSTTTQTTPINITNNFDLQYNEVIVKLIPNGQLVFAVSSLNRVFAWGNNFSGQLQNGTTTNVTVPSYVRLQQWLDYDTQTYDYQATLSLISNPSKTGYTFDGWYLDQEFTTPFILETMPAQDTVLYAKFLPNAYTLTLLSELDTQYTTITANYLQNINAPVAPSKTGYTFAGWYLENTFDTLYKFGVMEAVSRTLYAKWQINEYSITYLLDQENIKFVQIANGGYHIIALSESGQVFAWGYNNYGQIGDGTNTSRKTPVEITSRFNLLGDEQIVQVYAGTLHSMAITNFGKIFTWGLNTSGQIGDGTLSSKNSPVNITANVKLQPSETIDLAFVFTNSNYIKTTQGRIIAWGSDSNYKLGAGYYINVPYPHDITFRFGLASGEEVIQLVDGISHSLALTSLGRIFVWGSDSGYGVFASGSAYAYNLPVEITSKFTLNEGETITSIYSQYSCSFAITSDNRIFGWGYNSYGELGNGTTTKYDYPLDLTSVWSALDGDVVKIMSSRDFTAVLTSNDSVYTWGRNNVGQLGDGTTTNRLTMQNITNNIALNEGEIVVDLYGSPNASLVYVLTSDGRIFRWGFNSDGVLGDGTIINQTTPYVLNVNTWKFGKTLGFDYGETIQHYTAPTKEGYTFDGWYSNSNLTTVFADETMGNANVVLYAKWILNP
ncbi:MAG: InlB B-repeat-containing protein, partial [Bacilli bacterium]